MATDSNARSDSALQDPGYEAGDICRRSGCVGVIVEGEHPGGWTPDEFFPTPAGNLVVPTEWRPAPAKEDNPDGN